MQQYYDKINETARIIQSYITEHTPEFAIILGSGLSKLEDEVEVIFQVNGKIKARVMVPANSDAATMEEIARNHESVKSAIEGKTVRKVIKAS